MTVVTGNGGGASREEGAAPFRGILCESAVRFILIPKDGRDSKAAAFFGSMGLPWDLAEVPSPEQTTRGRPADRSRFVSGGQASALLL